MAQGRVTSSRSPECLSVFPLLVSNLLKSVSCLDFIIGFISFTELSFCTDCIDCSASLGTALA